MDFHFLDSNSSQIDFYFSYLDKTSKLYDYDFKIFRSNTPSCCAPQHILDVRPLPNADGRQSIQGETLCVLYASNPRISARLAIACMGFQFYTRKIQT